MQPIESLLDLPTKTAVRWLALTSLQKAARARERLRPGGDPTALHDLRVALRRLRSTLRALRPALDDTVTRADRRRLHALLRECGPGRDLEARTGWVEKLLADDPEALARCAPLLQRLRAQRDEAVAAVTRRLDRRFPRAFRKLENHLSHYDVLVDEAEVRSSGSMRRALGPALTRTLSQLRARLASLDASREPHSAHRVRLAVKRLRYILGPFARELVGAGELERELGELQALLGDFRELWELERGAAGSEPLDASAWEHVRGLARRRGEQARAELFDAWLPDRRDGLLESAERLIRELRGPRPDLEIERKFLLNGLPEIPGVDDPLEVEQGWFGDRLPERVRRVRDGAGERYFRAIKSGAGLVRLEIEEPISADVFASLWPLTEGRRVRKRRYRVHVGDLCWEIDLFADRDLVLAEVELPAADHPLAIPTWLRARLVREVTGEGAYVNLNLAR